MLPPQSSMISPVISSWRRRRKLPTSSSSFRETLLRAAIIARMRASFSAAKESITSSHSSA